jgi:hypothetical protein
MIDPTSGVRLCEKQMVLWTLSFLVTVAFSCCLTLKIQGEEIFAGLDLFGV